MDFANEHYVRLYTRDTLTMKRLGWHGRAVLWHVLRRMDMAGVLEVDGIEPWEACVLHCDAPEADARAGMAKCLELGVLVHNPPYLIAPNYRSANEASKSDRQRQLESRNRRRSTALGGINRASSRKDVDRDNASRNVTGASRPVTNGHASGRSVTAGHTPSQAVTRTGSGSGSDAGSDAVAGTGSEKINTGAAGADLKASARARASQPAARVASQPEEQDPERQLVRALAEVWAQVSGEPHDGDERQIDDALHEVQRYAARYHETPLACWTRAAQTFVADCGKRGKRAVLRWLCAQFPEWAQPEAEPQLSEDERRASARARAADRERHEFLDLVESDLRKQQRAEDEPEDEWTRKAREISESAKAERERRAAEQGEQPAAPQPAPKVNGHDHGPAALSPAHAELRAAQQALREARDRNASEAELEECRQRVQRAARAGVAESRARRGEQQEVECSE